MSLANAFKQALVNQVGNVGTTVYLPFTEPCSIGDIGRINQKGWERKSGASALPIGIPETKRIGMSSLTINNYCKVEGDLEAAASTVTESGGTATGSAKITFSKTTSLYFFVPFYFTETVKEGPVPFGNDIWKAIKNNKKKYKKPERFDYCVYQTYRAKSGIYLGTRSTGMSLTLKGTFQMDGEGNASASFTISDQTSDVVKSQYNPHNNPDGAYATFACDVFRWRAAGHVSVKS
ncbi:MAG: hypothetical protein AAFZ15_16985 [Bacteroidota bacterium]